MHVHPVSPRNLKLQQPQLPRSKPDGQPTESSHLANRANWDRVIAGPRGAQRPGPDVSRPTAPNLMGCQINLSKVGLYTISLAGTAWVMFRIVRRAFFSWRLLNTFGDNQLLRFVKAPPSIVVEVASISVGIFIACLTAIALSRLLNRRRVGPHREAGSIPEFTTEIKLRAGRPDIAHAEQEPEKKREREL